MRWSRARANDLEVMASVGELVVERGASPLPPIRSGGPVELGLVLPEEVVGGARNVVGGSVVGGGGSVVGGGGGVVGGGAGAAETMVPGLGWLGAGDLPGELGWRPADGARPPVVDG
ncbi:MAG: hypothetical protein ACRDZQ_00095 [Acidimicrobiales bacterium]